jgi:hypothetical protein
MPKEVAQQEYLDLVQSISPDSLESVNDSDGSRHKKDPIAFNVRVSTCNQEEILQDDQKTVFDWAREGNLERIQTLIKSSKSLDLCAKDQNVLYCHSFGG